MTETGVLFFSLLAVLCQVFLLVILVLRIGSTFGDGGRRRYEAAISTIGPVALPLAWAVAATTVAGSLFLSEVAHFEPCHFCWAQRVALYPQVVLIALLLWRKARSHLWTPIVAMLIIDIPISIYHHLIERFPNLETSSCDPTVPCSLVYVWKFHYLSIPLMALTSAITQLTLLWLWRRHNTFENNGSDQHASGPEVTAAER